MRSHYNIKVIGNVQGVFFRASTVQKANELNVFGTVRNADDGSVLIEVEGSKKQMESFLKWCHQGPILAKVKEVQINQSPMKNYTTFEIIYN